MLTKEGVEALLQVKAQKLAEPESLNMGVWIQTECDTPCGTVSCIAGQLIINKFIEENSADSNLNDLALEAYASQAASKILGFTDDEWNITEDLFHRNYWPVDLHNAYARAAENSKERAEILGQVIDQFIKAHYKPEEKTKNA
jgi:hypothetical protein